MGNIKRNKNFDISDYVKSLKLSKTTTNITITGNKDFQTVDNVYDFDFPF